MFKYLLKNYKLLLQSDFNIPLEHEDTSDSWKTIWIFASGWKEGWWSGAKLLIEKILDWEITWVKKVLLLSNHVKGGVHNILNGSQEKKWLKERVDASDIEFEFVAIPDFPKRVVDESRSSRLSVESEENITNYCNELIETYKFDYTFLSGWLKMLLEIKAVNIHPGPTQDWYGWDGKHWDIVHNMIWNNYKEWTINQSCVTMHWITGKYDDEEYNIVQVPVSLAWCNSADDVWTAVNKMEHEIQWKVTKMIIDGDISWSWEEDDEVIINQEVVERMSFPEWTVFGKIKEWFLKEGRPYVGQFKD